MSWYDRISPLYDIGSTGSGQSRRDSVAQLRLASGDTVLDLACGTGLNFTHIQDGIGPGGLLIGLDFSSGMLAKGRRKVKRNGWNNVRLIQADAGTISSELIEEHAGASRVDKALCTLGMSVIPEWETALSRSFGLVKPGGRYVIMDWWLERRTPFARFLEMISNGDVSRRSWIPLEDMSEDFSRTTSIWGRVFVAGGTVPSDATNGNRE